MLSGLLPNMGKEENRRHVPVLGGGSQAITSASNWDVGCGLGVVAVRRSEKVWAMFTPSGRKKVPNGVKPLMIDKRLGGMTTVVIIRTVGGHQ